MVATVSLQVGTAWAAAGNSIHASGPRHATAGHTVKLEFRGHAASGVRRLLVWLDDQTCAQTAQAERGRHYLRGPSSFGVHGRYRAVLKVMSSSKGTHVACAYLTYRHSGLTAARASWRYVTS